MTLHVTNGDSAAAVMRKAGIEGEILPWRDVLHEGLVPARLPLRELSEVRAQFIADCGWRDAEAARAEFRARDERLAAFRDHEEVVLWFEHDLYDQLQLLQLLDFFAAQRPAQLGMVCVDEYLGTLTPQRMAALQGEKKIVTEPQLALGRRAWEAFRAPDPSAWLALLGEDTSVLPFLAGAVLRHLEQFPSARNGLNRTERQILEDARSGIRAPGRLFEASQKAEERIFMGDSTFWLSLQAMTRSTPAMLATTSGKPFSLPLDQGFDADFRAQEVEITSAGRDVLEERLDWIDIHGLDKWLGGVHLTREHQLRWDDAARLITRGKS